MRRAVWVVRDGRREISSGIVAGENQSTPPKEAEEFLAEYLIRKHKADRRVRDIENISVADVLWVYLEDRIELDKPEDEYTSDERHLLQCIGRLNEYWGAKMLSEINTNASKGYVKQRSSNGGGQGGARRDLETLRAAINHHSSENLHYGIVSVWLPVRGEPRDRWLTRDEAAKMIWTAYRYRETQTIHVGTNKGQKILTDRRPLRHIARFLLIGCYTGTRAGAIASASRLRAMGHSYVDLENGLFYRKPIGTKATKKRQTPVRLPPRLSAHLRRWARLGIAKKHFVEFNGKAVKSVKKGFAKVVQLAGIDQSTGKATPHTLRHTAATWLMQNGTDLWQAAGYLGMSVEVLERVYGHHHPRYQAEAAAGITRKPKCNQRVT
ncbi:site-specific integrase [Bradyrhizobium sp. WSM2254]|uniref:site-specific integrase n=1 Tax=Bradyrhizobium sp. WSM2254 TaxID=1188263 RepID=UPI0009FE6BC9|nr:site-specific integrase [Bradyrhizobium sp. WSM2254]